jgi:hypothetical protein
MSSFLKTFAFALAAFSALVSARNCTSADLSGAYNQFRLTNDPSATFAPGTSQVVSYDHPSDSPVKGIQALDVVLCGNDDGALSLLVSSGLPVSFDGDTADRAGSIQVRLPLELPAGTYHYRLTVNTATDICYFTSDAFNSTGQVEVCFDGESKCLDDTGFVECAVDATTLGSSNGTYTGQIQSCGAGTTCSQSGTVASCTAKSSGPVVNPGSGGEGGSTCIVPGGMQCLNETSWKQCVGAGSDWTWSYETQDCPPGTSCGPYQSDYIICQ